MSTRRKQQRFTDRATLIQAIDDAKWKLSMAIKKANQHDAERERLKLELLPLGGLSYDALTDERRVVFHNLDRQRRHHQEQGEALLRSMPRLTGRVAQLKAALGVFDTQTFGFVEDGSVIA